MGCDIHIIAQKRNEQGQWVAVSGKFSPFDWRSYGMYGWLAGVRNYSDVTPISEPRGLPDDFSLVKWEAETNDWLGDHSYSWLSVEELLAVDYDQMIEDRRVSRQIAPNVWHGGKTCGPGEGRQEALREFLGDKFMSDLAKLKELGAERIVFGFDS